MGAMYQWKKEFLAHSTVPDKQIMVLDGTAAKRIKKAWSQNRNFG